MSIPTSMQNELYAILLELRHSNELNESVWNELIQLNQEDMVNKKLFLQIGNYLNKMILPTYFNMGWLIHKDYEDLHSKFYFNFSNNPVEAQKLIRDVCRNRVLEKLDYLLFESECSVKNNMLKNVVKTRLPELINELYEKNENGIYYNHKAIHLSLTFIEYSVNVMNMPINEDLLLFVAQYEEALKNIGLMWLQIFEINNCVLDDLLKNNCINVFANGKGKQILSWFIFLQENQSLTKDNFVLGIHLAYHGFLEDRSLISHLETYKDQLPGSLEALIFLNAEENLNLETMKASIGYEKEETFASISYLNFSIFRPFVEVSDDSDLDSSHDLS